MRLGSPSLPGHQQNGDGLGRRRQRDPVGAPTPGVERLDVDLSARMLWRAPGGRGKPRSAPR